jgi:hypothetical protein
MDGPGVINAQVAEKAVSDSKNLVRSVLPGQRMIVLTKE